LLGKPEGKRPLGNSRRRWEGNIRTDVRERECEGLDWIHLVQRRDQWQDLVNAMMGSRVP